MSFISRPSRCFGKTRTPPPCGPWLGKKSRFERKKSKQLKKCSRQSNERGKKAGSEAVHEPQGGFVNVFNRFCVTRHELRVLIKSSVDDETTFPLFFLESLDRRIAKRAKFRGTSGTFLKSWNPKLVVIGILSGKTAMGYRSLFLVARCRAFFALYCFLTVLRVRSSPVKRL